MSSTTGAERAGRLDGTTALVTGGSRGIGLACAHVLHAAGARVALVARDGGTLAAAAKTLGAGVTGFAVDLANPADVPPILARVRQHFGGAPDIIVNNAGQFLARAAGDTSVADFERLLRVNLTSSFAIAREFIDEMQRRGHGHIVTIGSIADRRGMPGNAAYSASKFGLRGLHQVLRQELRGTGVRATLVSPARVDTTLWDDVTAFADEDLANRDAMLPARAVAEAVLYAVSQPAGVNVDELRVSRA
jgi:NADP-dependent 3-hydroxy acid dehydrogenase YdfG